LVPIGLGYVEVEFAYSLLIFNWLRILDIEMFYLPGTMYYTSVVV
jgi:hypothetical protein